MARTLYVGIDLGKGFHQVAVVDERKERLGEPFKIGRGRSGIELMLRRLGLWGAKPEDLWACIENAPDLGWQTDDLLLEVNVQLDELEMLERQVERLDERIAELYSEVDPEQRLMKIGGLGEFLAAALTASLGTDVRRRFPSTKHVVSFAGLAPRVKSSAGHTKTGQGITKRGNPFLRAWAYLGASCARQYDPELEAYYHRMRDRGKHYNLVTCATAARLLERCYEALSQGGVVEMESQKHEVRAG
jgi:transposase